MSLQVFKTYTLLFTFYSLAGQRRWRWDFAPHVHSRWHQTLAVCPCSFVPGAAPPAPPPGDEGQWLEPTALQTPPCTETQWQIFKEEFDLPFHTLSYSPLFKSELFVITVFIVDSLHLVKKKYLRPSNHHDVCLPSLTASDVRVASSM